MRLLQSALPILARRLRCCGLVAAVLAGASGLLGQGKSLEASQRMEAAEYPVPSFEYQFEQGVEYASPQDYRSVRDSGLPLAMRHRVDAIWSGATRFTPMDTSASDFPIVGEVVYRLRRSAWSDPERMAQARLLDGTVYQALFTREFQAGRTYEVTGSVESSESIFASDGLSKLEQGSAQLELKAELSRGADVLLSAGVSRSELVGSAPRIGADEAVIKAGVGVELSPGLYGQAMAGTRVSNFDGEASQSAFEWDAALVWEASVDSQYILTFNRADRPSLTARELVSSDTISLTGSYTLSDMWSARFGAAQTWASTEKAGDRELYTGEVAISFSPSESVNFSGGYIFRSGSLAKPDEKDAETILRFSTSILY